MHHPRMHIKLHLCSFSKLSTQNTLPISHLLPVDCNCWSLFVLRSHNSTLQLLLYIHNWRITGRNTTVLYPRKPSIHHLRHRTPPGHKLYHFLSLYLSLHLLFQPKHQPGAVGRMERAREREGGSVDKLPCVHRSPTLQFMPYIAYKYIKTNVVSPLSKTSRPFSNDVSNQKR
jgi:hypothetical protein